MIDRVQGRRKPRVMELGLNLKEFSISSLQEIAEIVENTVREYISQKLGRRLDQLNVIVKTEVNDVLRVTVDVELIGRSKGRLDFNTLIEEAIREAYSRVEEVLRNAAKGSRGESNKLKENT